MIESLSEVYDAFAHKVTRNQFDRLVDVIYFQLHQCHPESPGKLEDEILLKIMLIQRLKDWSPQALLPDDIMPLLNQNPDAVNDQQLYDKYRCPLCQKLMLQCYSAGCNHSVCLKCIVARCPTSCPVCQMPISDYTNNHSVELFVRSLTFECPFCRSRQLFAGLGPHIGQCQQRADSFQRLNIDQILKQASSKYTFLMKVQQHINRSLCEGNMFSGFFEALNVMVNQDIRLGGKARPLEAYSGAIRENTRGLFGQIYQLINLKPLSLSGVHKADQAIAMLEGSGRNDYYRISRYQALALLRELQRAQAKQGFGLFGRGGSHAGAEQLKSYEDQVSYIGARLESYVAALSGYCDSASPEGLADYLRSQARQLSALRGENARLRARAGAEGPPCAGGGPEAGGARGCEEPGPQRAGDKAVIQGLRREVMELQDLNAAKQGRISQLEREARQLNERVMSVEANRTESQTLLLQSAGVVRALEERVKQLELQLQAGGEDAGPQGATERAHSRPGQSGLGCADKPGAPAEPERLPPLQQLIGTISDMSRGAEALEGLHGRISYILTRLNNIDQLQLNSVFGYFQLQEQRIHQSELQAKKYSDKVGQLSEELKTMSINGENITSQNKELLNAQIQLVQEIADLKQQLEDGQQTVQQVLCERDGYLREIDSKTYQIEQLNTQMGELNKKLEAAQQEHSKTQKELLFEQNDNKKMKNKMQQFEDDAIQERKHNKQLKDTIKAMENNQEQYKIELIQCYKQLIQLEADKQQNQSSGLSINFLGIGKQKQQLGSKQEQLLELYSRQTNIDDELKTIREIFNGR